MLLMISDSIPRACRRLLRAAVRRGGLRPHGSGQERVLLLPARRSPGGCAVEAEQAEQPHRALGLRSQGENQHPGQAIPGVDHEWEFSRIDDRWVTKPYRHFWQAVVDPTKPYDFRSVALRLAACSTAWATTHGPTSMSIPQEPARNEWLQWRRRQRSCGEWGQKPTEEIWPRGRLLCWPYHDLPGAKLHSEGRVAAKGRAT